MKEVFTPVCSVINLIFKLAHNIYYNCKYPPQPKKDCLKKRGSVNKDWWGLLQNCHLFQMFSRHGPGPSPPLQWKWRGFLLPFDHMYLLVRGGVCVRARGWGVLESTHGSPHPTLKGIRNISMCYELPQITPQQRFHDIVAVLAHYHNVTAAMCGCCAGWGLKVCIWVCVLWGGGVSCRYRASL